VFISITGVPLDLSCLFTISVIAEHAWMCVASPYLTCLLCGIFE